MHECYVITFMRLENGEKKTKISRTPVECSENDMLPPFERIPGARVWKLHAVRKNIPKTERCSPLEAGDSVVESGAAPAKEKCSRAICLNETAPKV